MREVVLVILIALITFGLRAFPFALFSSKDEMNPLLMRLEKKLPVAVMILLVLYCIRSISFNHLGNWFPSLLAIALVAFIHLKRKNVLLSILIGTFFYMFLIQYLFK